MTGILTITNGTDSVTLLAKTAGVSLNEWIPQNAAPKGGGVWAESPFMNDRQLVMKNRNNVIDSFDVSIMGNGQDIAIANLKTLTDLLEQAVAYWVDDWQIGVNAAPVWIEYRGECETNTSYAYLYDYTLAGFANPFDFPLIGGMADALTLVLEHGAWRGNPPGEYDLARIYGGYGSYGTNINNASAVMGDHFFTNKFTAGNLSHVYFWDNSLAAFSANLIAGSVPLFTLPVQVNDALYFGSVTAPQIPFDNIVLTLSAVGDGNVSASLQYWNGAAWTNIGLYTTGGISDCYPKFIFDATGAPGAYIIPARRVTDWATTAVNGQVGYWLRLHVDGITVAPIVAPAQDAANIYSVQWPWIDILGDDISGDLESLARLLIQNADLSFSGGALDNRGEVNRLIIASRSRSRGTDFVGYLPIGALPAGMAFTGASAVNPLSPSGYTCNYAPVGASAESNIAQWDISANGNHWEGEYRIFVRYIVNSGASVALRFTAQDRSSGGGASGIENTTGTYFTDNTVGALFNNYILDMGTITLSGAGALSIQQARFILYATATAASDIEIMDIALVPVDEKSVEIIFQANVTNYTAAVVEHNSTYPKEGAYSVALYNATLFYELQTKILSQFTFVRKRDQRIFLFAYRATSSVLHAVTNASFGVGVNLVNQYLFARGDQ